MSWRLVMTCIGTSHGAPSPETSAPPSKSLERALKLYDRDDYYMGSILFDQVIDKKSGDDESNIQKAEFFMGKTLFNLRFYSASLSYFSKIVDKGASHRYYQRTLQWLASLSKFLPESAGVLEKIGKYQRADLEQPALEPVRNELYYLLGRFYYQKGDLGQSIALFGQVPDDSDYYIPAQFFLGVAETREFHGPQAVEAFKSVLRKNITLQEAANKNKKKLKKEAKKKKKADKKLAKSGIAIVHQQGTALLQRRIQPQWHMRVEATGADITQLLEIGRRFGTRKGFAVGMFAGQQFIQYNPQGIDVGTGIDIERIEGRLFRSHVERGADDRGAVVGRARRPRPARRHLLPRRARLPADRRWR